MPPSLIAALVALGILALGILFLQVCLLRHLLIRRVLGATRDGNAGGSIVSSNEVLNERLRNAFDGVEDQLCLLDRDGRIVESNAAWRRFAAEIGYEAEGAPGGLYGRFCEESCAYGGQGPDELSRAARQVIRREIPRFEAGYASVIGGEKRYLWSRISPVNGHGEVAAMVQQSDRTAERLAELASDAEKNNAVMLASAMEASQKSIELAVRGGNLGLWHWDIQSGYFELSDDWLATLGHKQVDLSADIDTFRGLIHPEERVLWTHDDIASLAPDEPYDRQFRLRRADGSYAWVQALGSVNAGQGEGAAESLSGTLIDIDARKLSELRDAGMAKIIEDSLNEVFVFDSESLRFIEVNRGARENLGYSLEELRGMTPIDIKPGYTAESFAGLLAELDKSPHKRMEFETVHRRSDGGTYPVMISLQRSVLMGRRVCVAFAVDLTQRRKLEMRLNQSQRLESIGRLSAGIAHEMNTPLQYVGANIQYLSDCSERLSETIDAYQRLLDVETEPLSWQERYESLKKLFEQSRIERIRTEMPQAVADCREGIDRVLRIVRAMKDFSHPGGQPKTSSDLNRAVQSTATVTRNRWKEIAELDLRLDPDLPDVVCEPGSINQVILNLIVNAADAVADRIATDPGFDMGRITVRTYSDAGGVTIEVRDNGCGMPPEVCERVFDPFFTTKEVGRGSGQGLALSHTIVVQNHGGALDVQSTPGEGTVLRITLPVTPPQIQPEAEAAAPAAMTQPVTPNPTATA